MDESASRASQTADQANRVADFARAQLERYAEYQAHKIDEPFLRKHFEVVETARERTIYVSS